MKEKSHKKRFFILAILLIVIAILFEQGFFGDFGLGTNDGDDLNIVSIEDTPQYETQEETSNEDNDTKDQSKEETMPIIIIQIEENDVYINDKLIPSDDIIKNLEDNYTNIKKVKLLSDNSKLVTYTKIKKELEKYNYEIEEE